MNEFYNEHLNLAKSPIKLRRVKCECCGVMVIPWDQFPRDLQPILSCSVGVHAFVKKEVS